jgi:hypothetical protein
MPKIMVSLAQRQRLCGVCAGWCCIFYNKYDRSTQSLDPEALDELNSSTLGILDHFSHFRHF